MNLKKEPEYGILTRILKPKEKTQREFEADAMGLSPAERRLYEYLEEQGEASTIEVRQNLGIGNVSSAAMFFNRKLEDAGMMARIICDVRSLTNRYGEDTRLGWWRIVEVSEQDSAA